MTERIVKTVTAWLLQVAYRFLKQHSNIIFIEPTLNSEGVLQSYKYDSFLEPEVSSYLIIKIAEELMDMEDTLEDAYQIYSEAASNDYESTD